MFPFSVRVHACSTLTLVRLGGELDADAAPSLAARLRPLAAMEQPLLLELDTVEFCDCAGLGVFLNLARTSTAGLVLVSPSGAVRRIVHLTGCDGAPPIAESLAAALDLLERPTAATALHPQSVAHPKTPMTICGEGVPQ